MKTKRPRISCGFVVSSTSVCLGLPSDAVVDIEVDEDDISEVSAVALESQEVYDPYEQVLNQHHQQISKLPFDRGRGDYIRQLKASSFSAGVTIHSDKSLYPINIDTQVQLALARYPN